MVFCGLCRGPWMVGCGFVVGGDIEWVVSSGGHKGWVGCFCLHKRDTHRDRERKICRMENKNEL